MSCRIHSTSELVYRAIQRIQTRDLHQTFAYGTIEVFVSTWWTAVYKNKINYSFNRCLIKILSQNSNLWIYFLSTVSVKLFQNETTFSRENFITLPVYIYTFRIVIAIWFDRWIFNSQRRDRNCNIRSRFGDKIECSWKEHKYYINNSTF